MRIAIIEDDEITRLELSKLLNTQGYETVLLIDFGNLTDELKQYSIELVLLDINLPDGNGLEFCKIIRETSETPVLFLTANDTEEDMLDGFGVGCDDYISKPFSIEVLRKKSIGSSKTNRRRKISYEIQRFRVR